MENQVPHTHEMEIFNAFSNIAAHMHMADGWIDSLFPYQKVLHVKNPTILPQLVKARGEMKISLKNLRKFIRDDDDAIDVMYQHIGKSVSLLAVLPLDKRRELIEAINKVCVDATNSIQTEVAE